MDDERHVHRDEPGPFHEKGGFHRFVAIGDSTTEGWDDPGPDGGYRGWADRLADRLAAVTPHLRYANLAVRGKYVEQVAREQCGHAVALAPDLAGVIAGVNDLLRTRCDVDEVVGRLDSMFAALIGVGATVVTVTQPDPLALAGARWARPLRSRLRAYNDGVRASGARRGVVVVDFAEMPEAAHPRYWSADRLHLSTAGHQAMASTIAEALGVPPLDGPVAAPAGHPTEAALSDLAWVRTYLAPWLWRHVRGRSSGDGVQAKRWRLDPWVRVSQDAW